MPFPVDLDGWMLFRNVCMLVGLACIYYAVRLMRRRWAIRSDPVHTLGKVVSLDLHPTDEGPDWFTPKVRYRDEAGLVHDAEIMIVRDTETYAVGKKVPIIYERRNPKNIRDANDGWAEPIGHLLILGVGIVIFLFAAAAEVTTSLR